jgi:hypothetical protein
MVFQLYEYAFPASNCHLHAALAQGFLSLTLPAPLMILLVGLMKSAGLLYPCPETKGLVI